MSVRGGSVSVSGWEGGGGGSVRGWECEGVGWECEGVGV